VARKAEGLVGHEKEAEESTPNPQPRVPTPAKNSKSRALACRALVHHPHYLGVACIRRTVENISIDHMAERDSTMS